MIFRQVMIGPPGDVLWRLEILAGIVLVLSGILIAIFPQILVALISAIVVLCGVTLLGAGWRGRRAARYRRTNDYEIIEP